VLKIRIGSPVIENIFSLRRHYPVQVLRVSSQPPFGSTPEIQSVYKRTGCKINFKMLKKIFFYFVTK
jgi:hypothetical protein